MSFFLSSCALLVVRHVDPDRISFKRVSVPDKREKIDADQCKGAEKQEKEYSEHCNNISG